MPAPRSDSRATATGSDCAITGSVTRNTRRTPRARISKPSSRVAPAPNLMRAPSMLRIVSVAMSVLFTMPGPGAACLSLDARTSPATRNSCSWDSQESGISHICHFRPQFLNPAAIMLPTMQRAPRGRGSLSNRGWPRCQAPLVHGDLLALRLGRLGHGHRQQSIPKAALICSASTVLRQREGALEGAAASSRSRSRARRAQLCVGLRGDGEQVVLDVDGEVLLGETGQLGLQVVAVGAARTATRARRWRRRGGSSPGTGSRTSRSKFTGEGR